MELALVILTGVLAATTAVYAFFTWRMVDEMGKARRLTIRPHVTLLVRPYSPLGGHLALRSIGAGTALDVDVAITFRPSNETRKWRGDVLSVGEEVAFILPKAPDGSIPNLEAMKAGQLSARVNGLMSDISGEEYAIEDEIDLAEWATAVGSAEQLYERDLMEKAVSQLGRIASELGRQAPGR